MARNLTQIKDAAYIPPELIALTHQSVTPEQFEELCREYNELRLELTSTGELIVMPVRASKLAHKTPTSHLNSQCGPQRMAAVFAAILRLYSRYQTARGARPMRLG
jgi:hypothetical protein